MNYLLLKWRPFRPLLLGWFTYIHYSSEGNMCSLAIHWKGYFIGLSVILSIVSIMLVSLSLCHHHHVPRIWIVNTIHIKHAIPSQGHNDLQSPLHVINWWIIQCSRHPYFQNFYHSPYLNYTGLEWVLRAGLIYITLSTSILPNSGWA